MLSGKLILFLSLCFCVQAYGDSDLSDEINKLKDGISQNSDTIYITDEERKAVVLGLGAIIGIVIGSIVLFILCCVCILRCCCGCCQRDRTYVQSTTVFAQPAAANHTFINMAQQPYPNAPPPNQPYPHIPPPAPNQPYPHIPPPVSQHTGGYEPLANEAPPQYFPK